MEPSERISLAAVARACAENMLPSDLGTSTSTSNGVGGAAAAGSHAESIKRTKNKKASTVTARLAQMALRPLEKLAGHSSASSTPTLERPPPAGSTSPMICNGTANSTLQHRYSAAELSPHSSASSSQNPSSLPSPNIDEKTRSSPRRSSPAGSSNGAAAATHTSTHSSPRAAVVGPHGATAAEVRLSLMAHPNSPLMIDTNSSRFQRPARPVAVLYSPSSHLPRKVRSEQQPARKPEDLQMPPPVVARSTSTSKALETATTSPELPGKSTSPPLDVTDSTAMVSSALPTTSLASQVARACPLPVRRFANNRIRRLGWEVHCASVASVMEKLADALVSMGVQFEQYSDSSLEHSAAGFITRHAHVSDGMGAGGMRATILVRPAGNSPAALRVNGNAAADPTQPPPSPRAAALTAALTATTLDKNEDTSLVARPAMAARNDSPPSPSAYRIDVSRYSGDTFQFHAFYRHLREVLQPLLGIITPPAPQPMYGQLLSAYPSAAQLSLPAAQLATVNSDSMSEGGRSDGGSANGEAKQASPHHASPHNHLSNMGGAFSGWTKRAMPRRRK